MQRNVDGHLLTAADDDEVDMLDGAPDRVALDLLRQRELLLAAADLDRQQGVHGAQGEEGLVARQRDMDRIGAVTVDDRGHLVLTADPAGGALAELGARLGGELDLVVSHEWFSSTLLATGGRLGKGGPVDHGTCVPSPSNPAILPARAASDEIVLRRARAPAPADRRDRPHGRP